MGVLIKPIVTEKMTAITDRFNRFGLRALQSGNACIELIKFCLLNATFDFEICLVECCNLLAKQEFLFCLLPGW